MFEFFKKVFKKFFKKSKKQPNEIVIHVAHEFSNNLGGRKITDGKFSAEEFQNSFLIPAIEKNPEQITIILDELYGIPAAWLEETFGGIYRRFPTLNPTLFYIHSSESWLWPYCTLATKYIHQVVDHCPK